MTIAELFARIGVKADDSQIKRFAGSMKAAKVGMIAVSAAAAGTALVIKKITTEAMAAAVAFKQFEVETGASAQELQKWQSVAEQTNQSAESVSSAIKSIVANQEKIKLGQGNISGFQLLGIDPRQDPFKILEDLRIKTKGLSDGMKKNILQQMGVGVGLLQTLNLTREQFDAMSAKAFIISPQAIETLNKTKASVDLAGRAINYIKAQIAVGLAPQMEKLTKQFTNFIKVNEKGIIEGFKKAFTFVEKFTTALIRAGSMINTIVTGTIGWEGAIIALAGAFVILNASLIASPLGMITAGIIALMLVLEDLYVFSKGGDSVFGLLTEGIKDVQEAVGKNIEIGAAAQEAAGFQGSYVQGLSQLTNIKNDIKVEVHAGPISDPQALANKVNEALQGGLNKASASWSRDE